MSDADWWSKVLTGRVGAVRRGRGDGEVYVALPSSSTPRLVVDRANRAAIDDALGRSASKRGTPTALRGLTPAAGWLAARVGSAWSVAGTVDKPTLRQYLSDVIGEPVQLSIAVGPPRVNRKPVIRCYSGDREVAIAKLGPESHTSAMIANEASWLEQFTARPLDGLRTPRLLHAGRYGEQAIIVMDVLDLVGETPLAIDQMPDDDDRQVLMERAETGRGLQSSPWWQRLVGEAAGYADEALSEAIRRIERSPESDEITWSMWHGDWSPWNVGTDSAGSRCVWDWERAEVGVPSELDLVHLEYQYGSGLIGARRRIRESGHDAATTRVLLGAYLCELMCRHHAAGGDETDTQVMDRSALRAVLGMDEQVTTP